MVRHYNILAKENQAGTPRNDWYSALNAICPYYTMFPLDFPLSILKRYEGKSLRILDPFCGRGTTILAARIKGHEAFGIDSSPVATAIALAKIATSKPDDVIQLAEQILLECDAVDMPQGDFWKWAFAETTFHGVCVLRDGLRRRRNDSAKILRAICLGALHGPLAKDPHNQSYFSNQMPRTFAAKPAYSIRYWRDRDLRPREVRVLEVIKRRVERLNLVSVPEQLGKPKIRTADSRHASAYSGLAPVINLIITSPPYYGMRTYIPDQWLRNWFVGGTSSVTYRDNSHLSHQSPDAFAESLSEVWDHIGERFAADGRMFVRFGAIPSRKSNPRKILLRSVELSRFSWQLCSVRRAKSAAAGRRQAGHMGNRVKSAPVEEHDFEFSLS